MSTDVPLGLNLAVLVGYITRPPTERVLPSDDRLMAYEVTVPRPGERAESVPVVWHDAPAWAVGLEVDDEILVVGRVRRRFFRSGGATQSRTEVVAERIVRTRDHRRVQGILARARARLDGPW